MAHEKEILAKIKMLDSGILPARNRSEMISMMSKLSEEEKRVFKRKFRKIWKKISRMKDYNSFFCKPKESPKKIDIDMRIYGVYKYFLKSIK